MEVIIIKHNYLPELRQWPLGCEPLGGNNREYFEYVIPVHKMSILLRFVSTITKAYLSFNNSASCMSNDMVDPVCFDEHGPEGEGKANH